MPDLDLSKSQRAAEAGGQWLAGGVGSMARGTGAGYAGHPIVAQSGQGARLTDVDGNTYIDYLLALGPLIHGHRPEAVTRAVVRALEDSGSMLGLATELEYAVARQVVEAVPSVDLVRFSNSGTEVVQMALRLARAFTGKEKIVKFEGHFHGWGENIHWSIKPPLPAAGLAHAPRAVPVSPGVPEGLGGTLIIQPWNNRAVLERTLRERHHEIAAIITEPLMANCGCVEAEPGYLDFLRTITAQYGILLIFDEVITGFRLALGGAQAYYGVTPDLTTMAKALGAGYPVSALGGRRDIMDLVATNQVPYLGTYNTSTVVMAAAQATLAELARPGVYERLHALGNRLSNGLCQLFRAQGIPCVVQGPGPVFQLWFTDQPSTNYRETVARAKPAFYAAFQRAMLKRGVLFHPSQTEHFFLSTAHTEADIDATLNVAEAAVAEIKPQFI